MNLKNLFHRHDPDEPCPHMESLLQRHAEGKLRGVAKLYVLAHTAQCGPCRKFAAHIKQLLAQLSRTPRPALSDEQTKRLLAGFQDLD